MGRLRWCGCVDCIDDARWPTDEWMLKIGSSSRTEVAGRSDGTVLQVYENFLAVLKGQTGSEQMEKKNQGGGTG